MTIPASFVGLLVFIAMLWPGLTYSLVRERRDPAIRRSTFREALDVINVSLIVAISAVLIVAVLRVLAPDLTPNPQGLLFNTQQYLRKELTLVSVWSGILLLLSQAFAYILGIGLFRKIFGLIKISDRKKTASTLHESRLSAWWIAFSQYPSTQAVPYVGCQISDGSYLSGLLHSYSRDWEDLPDRDLVLLGPIRYRPAKSSNVEILDDVGMVVVSARNITMMTVTYQPADIFDGSNDTTGISQKPTEDNIDISNGLTPSESRSAKRPDR